MIIGLVGRRGSGKDTLADHLVANHGYTHLKFARPLKDAIGALFDLSIDHLEGSLKEEIHPLWGVSPRALMQFFGTEIMQNRLNELMPDIGSTHAVKRLFMTMDKVESELTVVSDVRFTHEVDALLARGALIIRVDRGSDRTSLTDDHISESGVDGLFSHATVDNNGSLESSYASLDLLLLRHEL